MSGIVVKVTGDEATIRFPQGSLLTPTALARVARAHLRNHPEASRHEWTSPKLWNSMDRTSTLRIIHVEKVTYTVPGHPAGCCCGECLYRRKNLAEDGYGWIG